MPEDLGVARAVDAQSFGEPGQRTFRLRVISAEGGSVSLWLEKEHLQALVIALRQLLAELKYESTEPPPPVDDFPEAADHDFRAGRVGLGFHEADRTVILQVDEASPDEPPSPDDDFRLRLRLTLDQCSAVSEQLAEIISRGRPTCPLCGVPMDESGHACIRGNGHLKQPIPEESSDGDEDEPG
jgi:uncharacterized repeat protein (TIGR03847 family)